MPKSQQSKRKVVRSKDIHIVVRSVQRQEPDLLKLSRALLGFTRELQAWQAAAAPGQRSKPTIEDQLDARP